MSTNNRETPDLARLRATAEAATGGPWVGVPSGEGCYEIVVSDRRSEDTYIAHDIAAAADALYLSAFDPQTVLALIALASPRQISREDIAAALGLPMTNEPAPAPTERTDS